jgi:hypothetical protein
MAVRAFREILASVGGHLFGLRVLADHAAQGGGERSL